MIKVTILQHRLIVLLALFLLLPAATVLAQYSGGNGSASNPWQIANKADLLALGANTEDYNDCFVMTADINLAGEIYSTALISPEDPLYLMGYVEGFSGVFDGGGHKITGLTIDGGDKGCLGLFGFVTGGEIRNLGLENVLVSGTGGGIGSLVGHNGMGQMKYQNVGARISNCYSTGSVSGGGSVGGLVGDNHAIDIINCYSMGTVSGRGNGVGGLVGDNYAYIFRSLPDEIGLYGDGYISGSYSTGSVSGNGNYVGGLVGGNNGEILNCYSLSDVNGHENIGGLVGGSEVFWFSSAHITGSYSTGSVNGSGNYVGGLVGSWGSILNCYSSGDVNGGDSHVGGLVGGIGRIVNSYSTGKITGAGDYVGGLAGSDSSIWDSYSLSDVNGHSKVGGLVGSCDNDSSLLGVGGGRISNSYSTGSVCGSGDYVGGLAGSLGDEQFGCHISNSYSVGSVTGNASYVGGLVGEFNGSIFDSNSSSSVYGSGDYVGGLIGSNKIHHIIVIPEVDSIPCNISRCNSTGPVKGNGDYVGGLIGKNESGVSCSYYIGSVDGLNNVGGLVGKNLGFVSDCYSAAKVGGSEYVGGLIGYNNGSYPGVRMGQVYHDVLNCYSVSDINSTGVYVGGIAGYNRGDDNDSVAIDVNVVDIIIVQNDIFEDISELNESNILHCYWNKEIQTHCVTESIGWDENEEIINIAGLTTAQMQEKSTYTTLPTEWDFINTWGIGENQTYPYLREYSATDINQDKIVDYFDFAELANNWLDGI